MRKKLNLIVLTNLVFGALAMRNIRVMAKLDDVTHQIEPGEAWWCDLLSKT